MGVDLTPRPDSDYFSARPQYILALKAVTGVFSGLSLLGALTVIFFHVCCSKLWPNKIIRHIVVMLSIADLLLAISHIWGATQTLEKFMEAYHPNGSDFSNTDIQCTAQAILAVMGTLSSFLWTLAIVSYVLIVTTMPGKVAEWCQKPAVVALYSVLCWGFPLLLTIVLARLYLLGYAEVVDLGWCYVSFPFDVHAHDAHRNHLELLFGYELWSWLIIGAIILCIILYITVQYCKKKYFNLCEKANTASSNESQPIATVKRLDDGKTQDESSNEAQPITNIKRLGGYDDGKTQDLTSSMADGSDEWINVKTPTNRQVESQTGVNFRPVLAGVFLLGFRSISTIVDITIMVNDKKYYHANWIAILVVLAAIGDSLQGFVNMFLFVWCTPQVYTKSPCYTNHNQDTRYRELK